MKIEKLDVAKLIALASEPSRAPVISSAGAYVVLVADPVSLSVVLPGRQGVLYVGMTNQGLDARNHFRHVQSGFSTLRRSLGALLKETLSLEAIPRAPGNSKTNVRNYRFTDDGESALTDWMNRHLLLSQISAEGNVTALENDLIRLLEPPLNLKGWQNPQRGLVMRLRAACAAEAEKNRERSPSSRAATGC